MNGTVIDIPGISSIVIPIEMEDSTDKAYIISISDGNKQVELYISYGKITELNTKTKTK